MIERCRSPRGCCLWVRCSKGISDSALPYKRTAPSWLKVTATDVEEHVCRLSKKGLTPSQIGVHLRDSLGIAQASGPTTVPCCSVLCSG